MTKSPPGVLRMFPSASPSHQLRSAREDNWQNVQLTSGGDGEWPVDEILTYVDTRQDGGHKVDREDTHEIDVIRVQVLQALLKRPLNVYRLIPSASPAVSTIIETLARRTWTHPSLVVMNRSSRFAPASAIAFARIGSVPSRSPL